MNIYIYIYDYICKYIYLLFEKIYIFIYQGGPSTSVVHNLLMFFDSITFLLIQQWEHNSDAQNMNIDTCFKRTFFQGSILPPQLPNPWRAQFCFWDELKPFGRKI